MTLVYATDLVTGHSRDFALRSCVLGMRIAKVAGLDEQQRRNVYHQALLRYIGCNADTDLLAAAFGDEIALRRDLAHRHGQQSEVGEALVRAKMQQRTVDHFRRFDDLYRFNLRPQEQPSMSMANTRTRSRTQLICAATPAQAIARPHHFATGFEPQLFGVDFCLLTFRYWRRHA